MPNATAHKFGYPDSLIAEHGPWLVLLRPKAPTLGALTIVNRGNERAFGEIDAAGFAALQPVIAAAERMLKAFCGYERINHLMLMMLDPDVHFHVLPRYDEPRVFGDHVFPDAGWPGPPVLDSFIVLSDTQRDEMLVQLRAFWQI
jgi:diadenosine tetraphosphate (Ap4A) HIT family hydrolase